MEEFEDYKCRQTGITYYDIAYVASIDESNASMPENRQATETMTEMSFQTDSFTEECGNRFGTTPKRIIKSIKDHVRECPGCERIYNMAYREIVTLREKVSEDQ